MLQKEPVPKAVLGAALAKPRRPVIACSVCQIRFNSESQAAAHYQGNRHARRLKGLEAARARRGGDEGNSQDPPAPTSNPTGEMPERKGGFLHLEESPGVLVSPQGDVCLLGSLPSNPLLPRVRCVCVGGSQLILYVPAGEQPPTPAAPSAPGPPPPSWGHRGSGGDTGGTWGCNGGGGGGGEGEGQAAALLCPLQGGCQLPVPARGTQ
uniref:C2H2-type domain-containing protein n=1 Tax=Chrysolophus pictus TaxID=9089 RepID=A0A8C3Q305_CHRPC